MKGIFPTLTGLALAAMFVVGSATSSLAADAAEKPQRPVPFKGKISEVDDTAKTIKLEGKADRVFHVNSATRISRAGSPAKLTDAVVGELVTGSYHKTENGQVAVSVFLGGQEKPARKERQKKTESN
jgi:hypothetical protein